MVLFCTSSSEIIIARGISNTVSPTSKSSLAMVPRPAPSTSIWRIKHANYNCLVLWNFGAPPTSPTYNYTIIRNQIKHQQMWIIRILPRNCNGEDLQAIFKLVLTPLLSPHCNKQFSFSQLFSKVLASMLCTFPYSWIIWITALRNSCRTLNWAGVQLEREESRREIIVSKASTSFLGL